MSPFILFIKIFHIFHTTLSATTLCDYIAIFSSQTRSKQVEFNLFIEWFIQEKMRPFLFQTVVNVVAIGRSLRSAVMPVIFHVYYFTSLPPIIFLFCKPKAEFLLQEALSVVLVFQPVWKYMPASFVALISFWTLSVLFSSIWSYPYYPFYILFLTLSLSKINTNATLFTSVWYPVIQMPCVKYFLHHRLQ